MSIKGKVELSYISQFWNNEIKPPLDNALQITPDDRLDWAPGDNMITLGNIFMHIAECSQWWIGLLIDGIKFKDSTPGPSFPKDKIAEMMAGHWQRLDRFFVRATEIMDKSYPWDEGDKHYDFEGRWIMMHLLEHDIHHRSQINQYLRLLNVQPPKI